MSQEQRIRDLEARVNKMDDNQGCLGCSFALLCVGLTIWDIWTGGAVVRAVLAPWMGGA